MAFSNNFISFFKENDFFREYFEFPENTPTDLQLDEDENHYIIKLYFSFNFYSYDDRVFFLKILENNNMIVQIQILKFFQKECITFGEISSNISINKKIGLLEFIIKKG